MNESSYGTKSVLLLALAGLSSALLTIAAANVAPSVGRWAGGDLGLRLVEQFYEGIVFGGSIAAYFVLRERVRSVGKVIALIIACVAAHWASLFVSYWVFSMVHRRAPMGSPRLDIPLPALFGGGFVGAFIVLAAALFLFGRGDITWQSVGKVLFCAGVGGVLGVVGWACGPFLGGALWLGLKGLHLVPPSQTYQTAVNQSTLEYLSLRVVWQPGVALLLGLMLSSEDAIGDTANLPVRPVAPARRKLLRLAAILFFGGVFAFLGWQVSRVVRGQIAMMRRQNASNKMLAEAPAVEKLPSIEPMPVEKALLVEQIGGLVATKPNVFRIGGRPSLPNGAPPVPPSLQYSVGYAPVRDMLLLAATSTYLCSSTLTPSGRSTEPNTPSVSALYWTIPSIGPPSRNSETESS